MLKMLVLLIGVMCISASCGPPISRAGSIDPVFQDKYQKFLGYAKERGVWLDPEKLNNLSIQFNEIHYGDGTTWIVGLCTYSTYSDGTSAGFIDIDIKFWTTESDLMRESLLFHELGHCILGRNHLSDTLNGAPVSLMNPSVVAAQFFGPNYNAYIDELFSLEHRYR